MSPPGDAERVPVADFILRLRRSGITEPRLLSAIESVPRRLFVPADFRQEAYLERALPIDCGQTISAPELVGRMTAALDVGESDRVLEIGTGSGYQAAILSRLAKRVYTVERFRTLAEVAESRFRTLRLTNISGFVGDGSQGLPAEAPFDRIMVTAAAETVPQALLDQLRVGGVMVIPVGPELGVQRLLRITRGEAGYSETKLADVRFVPLIPGKAEHL